MSVNLYRHFDSKNTLLYVGVSLNAVYRLSQHKTTSRWFDDIARVDIEKHATREESIIAETEAIVKEKPIYNIMKKNQKIPASKQFSDMQKSIQALMDNVVNFSPIYSIREVASVFCVQPSRVEKWIKEKKLSYIEIEGRSGRWPAKMHKKVTGWQLISFIEYLESNSLDKE